MLGSESYFFNQSSKMLKNYKTTLIILLNDKGFSEARINLYLEAYNYFCKHPEQFDGATIVKDLCDLPGLDLSAMRHDYDYIVLNVASNIITKFKSDRLFGKSMTGLGKHKSHEIKRVSGLMLTSLIIVPYSLYKRGKMTKSQKNKFNLYYNTFK